jgi:hypothetical protein
MTEVGAFGGHANADRTGRPRQHRWLRFLRRNSAAGPPASGSPSYGISYEGQVRNGLDVGPVRQPRRPAGPSWQVKQHASHLCRAGKGLASATSRPRQDAVWGESEAESLVPVGQHMASLRRKGGLGKDPERAAVRAAQLTSVDEDWNCPWPLD